MNSLVLYRKNILNKIEEENQYTLFYLDIPVDQGRIGFGISGVDKDGTFICEWGDGTFTEYQVTSPTTSTNYYFDKTYEKKGKYKIKFYSKNRQIGTLKYINNATPRNNFISWVYKMEIGEPCIKIGAFLSITNVVAEKLTEILIKDNVTDINARAFLACQKLKKISLPFTGTTKNKTGMQGYFGIIFGHTTTTDASILYEDKVLQYQSTSSSGITTYYWYNIPTTLETVIITGDKGIYLSAAFNGCKFKNLIIEDKDSSTGLQGIKEITNLTVSSVGSSIPGTSSSELVYYYAFGSFFGETTEENGVKQDNKYLAIPKSLKKVVVTGKLKGVTTAGMPHYAFENCSFLEEIYYTNKVQWIGKKAFCNCSSLKNLRIGKTVENIFEGAFAGCTQLTSIKLPYKLSTIGAGVFSDCPNLEYIDTSNNPFFIYEDGILYSRDKSIIYYYSEKAKSTELIIPETVNKIMNYSIYNNSLEKLFVKSKVEITNSMFRNYNKAQEYCKNIKTIEVEGENVYINGLSSLPIETLIINEGTYFHMFSDFLGVKTLKKVIDKREKPSYSSNFFENCENLEDINLLKLRGVPEYLFKGCVSLKGEISLPEVSYISRHGFGGCTGITSLNLSNNTILTEIGYNAFSGCTNLSGTLYFPPSLKEVGTAAFQNTGGENGYDHIIYDCIYCQQYSALPFAGVKINKITIGDSVERITGFFSKALFSQIVIPENVIEIDSSAFTGCSELESINIKGKPIVRFAFDNTKYYNTEGNWEKDLLYLKGEKATFLIGTRNAEQVNAVYLPDDLFYLPNSAFYRFQNLKRIAFGEDFKEIGISALSYTEITDFYFPKKMIPTQEINNSNYDDYFGYYSYHFKRIFFQGSEEEWPNYLANLQKVWTWGFMINNESIYYNCEIASENSISIQGKNYLEGIDTYYCIKNGYVGLPSTDTNNEYFELIEMEETTNASEES